MALWRLTLSFTRFNAKYAAEFTDLSDAKRAGMKAAKEGIWVTNKDKSETFWAPAAIGKIHLELVEEETMKPTTGHLVDSK